MAGYSGTPLARKLGIKEGATVALVGAPPAFEAELEPLPGGVRVVRTLPAGVDVAVLFATERADLDGRFPEVARHVQPAGGLWVAWPKRSGRW